MSEKTVFLSYRRDVTGSLFARSIKEALTVFGYDVFLDVDSLNSGTWSTQILTQVPKRSHFLLLLTNGSLDRCSNEDDWVRQEYFAAVASRRNIVPVRESAVDLQAIRRTCPECMKSLFECQIAEVHHSGFARDIATLIERFIAPHRVPTQTELASNVQIREALLPTAPAAIPQAPPRVSNSANMVLGVVLGVLVTIATFLLITRKPGATPSVTQNSDTNVDPPKARQESSPRQQSELPRSDSLIERRDKSDSDFRKGDIVSIRINDEVPCFADDTTSQSRHKVKHGEKGMVKLVRNTRCLIEWNDRSIEEGWIPFDYLTHDMSFVQENPGEPQ